MCSDMVGNQRLECWAEGSTSVLLEVQAGSELTKATNILKEMGRIRSQSWAQNAASEPPLIMPRTIVEQFYNDQCLKLSIFKLPIFLIFCK